MEVSDNCLNNSIKQNLHHVNCNSRHLY